MAQELKGVIDDAFNAVKDNAGFLVRIGWLPIGLAVFASAVATNLFPAASPVGDLELGERIVYETSFLNALINVVGGVLYSAGIAIFSVAVHRWMLLGERPDTPILLRWGPHEEAFFLLSLLFYGAIMILAPLLTPILGVPTANLLAFLAAIVAFILFIRWCPALPIAALEGEIRLAQAGELTKGRRGGIFSKFFIWGVIWFVIFIVAIIPFSLVMVGSTLAIGQAALSAFVATLLFAPLTVFATATGITLLSAIFKRLAAPGSD